MPLFDTHFTPAAGSNPLDDHSYIQSIGSFDENKKIFFGGKLKSKDAVGVLPAGVCGHLVIRCYNCLQFVLVAMGKTHSLLNGQQIFDVNT